MNFRMLFEACHVNKDAMMRMYKYMMQEELFSLMLASN